MTPLNPFVRCMRPTALKEGLAHVVQNSELLLILFFVCSFLLPYQPVPLHFFPPCSHFNRDAEPVRKAGVVGRLLVVTSAEGCVCKTQDFVHRAHLRARGVADVEGQ